MQNASVRYCAYEIVSLVQVRGIPLQVRTVETGKDREECMREHGSSIAAAYPKAMGRNGLTTRVVRREDLEAWARDKAKEALERARMDSRKPSLPIPDGTPEVIPCLGCFSERVFKAPTPGVSHTCKRLL